MKTLTICQPYAHLICTGEKRVENRTWPTTYRGQLLIHAGKSRAWLDMGDEETYGSLVFGAVVGVANLVTCVNFNYPLSIPKSLEWVKTHEHASGPWCWVLGDVRRFRQPIPYRGAQGLFDVPDDVVAAAIAEADAVHPAEPTPAPPR